MIKYSIGVASVVALALLAAILPGSVSLASPARPGGATHQATRGAAPAVAPVAWVANQSVPDPRKGSVTPIDTATNAIIKKIPVSLNAIDVALTPDGKTAYIALNSPRPGGHGAVVPVSTGTYKVGKLIKVRNILPATMQITPNGKTLYVGDSDSGTVTPINTATNTAGTPIKTGPAPFAVAMAATPDSRTVYVVNEDPGTVTPINTATNTAGKNIKVGVTPGAIVVTPDGKTAYVLNLAQGDPGKGTVTPIDTATNTTGKPIKGAGTFPDAFNLMVITPNGKTLYAVGLTAVTPISTATNTAGKPIRVAPPHGSNFAVVIAPDGRTVYVAGQIGPRFSKGYVVPVSTATGAVGKAIVFRGSPYRMALTPDGKTLYVVRIAGVGPRGPQDVLSINTVTKTVGPAISTGQQPTAIAISGGQPN
jgi:YVTN family beta-propeller protein